MAQEKDEIDDLEAIHDKDTKNIEDRSVNNEG